MNKTVPLLLTAATLLSADITVKTQILHPDNRTPVANADVTLSSDDIIKRTTSDSSGWFEFVIYESAAKPTSAGSVETISFLPDGLRIPANTYRKIRISDLMGRQLFSQDISPNQTALSLPSGAAGYRLVTLIDMSGRMITTPWMQGVSTTGTQQITTPIQHSSKNTRAASLPDTLTITADHFAPVSVVVNASENPHFPKTITLPDQERGEAEGITAFRHHCVDYLDTTPYWDNEILLEDVSEGVRYCEFSSEMDIILEADGYYSTLIKPISNNDYITLDMDSVEMPETGVYGTVFTEEQHYSGSVMQTTTYEVCYAYEGTLIELRNLVSDSASAQAFVDSEGRYYFPNVPEGDYVIAVSEFSDLEGAVRKISTADSRKCDLYGAFYMMAVAPNIYLYPEETQEISVEIAVRDGGSIPYSIPTYNDGWSVTATPEGTINDSLDFLYYDFYSAIPYQSDSGWVVDMNNFDSEITTILSARGLNSAEIEDFIEFWKRFIEKYDWAVFCPIDADAMVELTVDPVPTTLFRELYLVLPFDGEKPQFKEPALGTPFERTGFTVVEWGGHLKELQLEDVIK